MLKKVFISLAVFLLAVLGITPAHAQVQRLDQGHIDAFNVTADGGELTLDLKEDATGSHVRHAPEDVELVVGQDAYTERTAEIPEIGKAGYMLPQTQRSDLIWPGWDTQGARDIGAIDLEFVEVTGPGEVYLFQTGSFGSLDPVLDGGSTRLETGSAIAQEEPAHVHANWLFTEPGTYQMRVVATGGGASSNEATYTWIVGDGEAAPVAKAEASTEAPAAQSKPATSAAQSSTTTTKAGQQQPEKQAQKPAQKPAQQPTQQPAQQEQPADERPDTLAETGTTVMTVPFAILGLGVAVFGAAMCCLDTALRRKLLALAGVEK
ncbi:choice-of-anchor M domain-containing protein [Corynebacterium haemomassiliense]|uniref:choice-of-anchor M domain-containing protein n=1 Tax=Corynebacterium haemomassiliense TaxID=2754726 RepID=UPI0028890D10|nr:choice-of-anchor M domain-containing protein [Corynebacterium haemomassiliense]